MDEDGRTPASEENALRLIADGMKQLKDIELVGILDGVALVQSTGRGRVRKDRGWQAACS